MVIPTKKLKNGFEIPVFGFGTWRMAGDSVRDYSNDDTRDVKAIKTALELGITHIDTAEMYAEGHAEELVAEAIRNSVRSKLFITSKVWPTHLKYADVLTACKNSLKRLGTDYLDLYLVHWPNPHIPMDETFKALDELKELGLIKNIGVSNFSVGRLEQAQKLTKNKVVCNQVHYNLVYREPETTGLLSYCQKNDILLTAWAPIERGVLAEENDSLIKPLAQKYQKTPAQMAINWLVSQPNVVTICKMVGIAHMKENLGAVGWQMEEEDIELLRKEYPNQNGSNYIRPLS